MGFQPVLQFARRVACALLMTALAAGGAHAQMKGKAFTVLVVTDLSMVYSDTSGKGSVDAVKMAIDDFGGKVNGVPIRMIVLDNKLDADPRRLLKA